MLASKKKDRNKKGLALGAAASATPGGSQAPLPPVKPSLRTTSSSSSSLATHPSTTNGTSGTRVDYHNKLSEQLATLEVGLEFKLDLRAEDLQVLQELGAGNGGTVCKAVHVPTRLVMARKLVHIDAKPSVRRQILRELQIMHDCRSPYIVSFYGAYLQDPHICMCMEMMDKGSLDNIYKKVGPIPEPILGKIAVAVVSGLTYLYDSHRIIHRDVKPSNVLFNSQGQIKICDFGVSGELINSIADTFVGTSTYMSPERIQGAQYTVKSDVWSLGITLIELALGRFPFSDDPADSSDEEGSLAAGVACVGLGDDGGEPTLSPARPGQTAETLGQAMQRQEERERKRRAVAEKKRAKKQDSKGKRGGVSLEGGGAQMSILELLQHVVNEPAPKLPGDEFAPACIAFVDSCLVKDHDARPTPKQLMEDAWLVSAQATDVDLAAWAGTIP